MEEINPSSLLKEARAFAKEVQTNKLLQKLEPTIKLLHGEDISPKEIVSFLKKRNITGVTIANVEESIKSFSKNHKAETKKENTNNTEDNSHTLDDGTVQEPEENTQKNSFSSSQDETEHNKDFYSDINSSNVDRSSYGDNDNTNSNFHQETNTGNI